MLKEILYSLISTITKTLRTMLGTAHGICEISISEMNTLDK